MIDGSSLSSVSVSRTRSARERPAAGSSSIISFGSLARAMPTSSWRCSPCESSDTSDVEAVAEADGLRHRARLLAQLVVLARAHEPQMAVVDAEHRQVQVVLDGQAEEQAGGLERAREAHAGALARGLAAHVAAEQLDRPGGRGELPRDHVEERGLAGAVGPEDGPAFAGPDLEVHVTHGVNAAEAPADPPQAEDRRGALGGCLWCCHHCLTSTRSRPPRRCRPRRARCPPRTSGSCGPAEAYRRVNVPPNVCSTAGILRDRLHVRHLVAVGVGDDLLDVVVRDAVAVVVELDLAPRRVERHDRPAPPAACFWSAMSPSTASRPLIRAHIAV